MSIISQTSCATPNRYDGEQIKLIILIDQMVVPHLLQRHFAKSLVRKFDWLPLGIRNVKFNVNFQLLFRTKIGNHKTHKYSKEKFELNTIDAIFI